MSLIQKALRFKRATEGGIRRETTLGWCRAFVEDADRLLDAIEKDNVKEAIGGNTARLIKLLTDQNFLKVAVHETFISMRKYGESLSPSPEKEKEEEEIEAEIEGEPFVIKKKKNLSPVGDYFTNG